MDKFFESLTTKFFDFFNFGRFLTIIVPGLIITLSAAMLISQVLFPVRAEQVGEDASTGTVTATTTATAGALDSGANAPAVDRDAFFQKQVTEDFARIRRNLLPLALVTVIVGMMINEAGYLVIGLVNTARRRLHKRKSKKTNETPSASTGRQVAEGFFIKVDGEDLYRCQVTQSTGQNDNEIGHPMGIAYFAPFLKEKFSGDYNYFDFLVTEYYRFAEFAAVIPLTLLIADIIAFIYCYAFWDGNAFPLPHWIIVLAVTILIFAVLFTIGVFPKILGAYHKARRDLIEGVADFVRISEKISKTGSS